MHSRAIRRVEKGLKKLDPNTAIRLLQHIKPSKNVIIIVFISSIFFGGGVKHLDSF